MSGRQRRRARESAGQELARVRRELAATPADQKPKRRFLNRRIERLAAEVAAAPSRITTPPGRPQKEGRLVPDPLETALQSEADARIRTGDPFITSDSSAPQAVTSGHFESPDVTTQAATEDPSGQPERPQDAPTSGAEDASHFTPNEEAGEGVFAVVRDYAVACARNVTIVPVGTIQQAIDEADRAMTLGPILDPTLWQRGAAELEAQLRLLRVVLDFRIALDTFRLETT